MRRLGLTVLMLLISMWAFRAAVSCPPLPVLLYPVDEVYAEQGFEIPDLPDNAIARIGDALILKSEYKQWLYRKIGFEPDLKKQFLMTRRLHELIQSEGVDLEEELNLILDRFFYFEVGGRLYESTDAWHEQAKRMANITEHSNYRENARPRIEETYPEVFYLMQNWDDVHANVLEAIRVEHDALAVTGDDPELQRILHVLNAFYVMQRLEAWIQPYIRNQVLAGEDLNLPDYTEEYIDWLYANHNTKFLVENYLGMVLSDRYARKNNLRISEQLVQEEFALRLREYEELVANFNRQLPESAVPLAVSPVYVDYIMEEARDDFQKSMAHRRVNPIPQYALVRRYHDQFGFNGKRSEVREIFKWVRRRRGDVDSGAYAEYVAAEESRIRAELEALRDTIVADDVAKFPVYAIAANRNPELQRSGGLVDYYDLFGEPENRWGAVREYAEKLGKLDVYELSPVMRGPWNTLDLFWLAAQNGPVRVYHTITRDLPPIAGFDFKTYQEDLDAARAALKALKEDILQGASIEELAQEHSDSYRRYGVDISENHQTLYGYHFAEQVAEIPVGELGIIASDEGLHLVQVVAREYTPLTDTIREQIAAQYHYELANQEDRYTITREQLFRAHPYFRTAQ